MCCVRDLKGFDWQVPLIDIDMMKPGFVTKTSSCAASGARQVLGAPQDLHVDQELSTTEQAHVDTILSLHSAFKDQQSRSLDHYFHRDLTDTELQTVNGEQVLSRFIYHQQAKVKQRPEQGTCIRGIRIPRPRGVHPFWRSTMKELAKLRVASNVLEDMRIEDGPDELDLKLHLYRQHVLAVPQLWLWKIDSKSHTPHIHTEL